MKMMVWLTSALCLMSLNTQAGELEDKISSLRNNYDALDGYWAIYDAKTETGKTATFEQGADFASGWSFVRMELRDAEGKMIGQNEQWSTKEGDYIMRNEGDMIVFTGLGAMRDRIDNLRQSLKRDGKITPMRIGPNCYLTETGVSSAVGFSTQGLNWFSNVENLIKSNEKTVSLGWGEHGTIVLDQSTGLLVSQVIELKNGTREMKRTDWEKNPGAEMISSRMIFNLEGAKKRPLIESGIGRKMLGALLQDLIKEIGKKPKLGEDLKEYLADRQDAISEYLSQEILQGVPFLKEEHIFKVIERVSLELQEKLKDNGKEVSLERLLQDAGIQKTIVSNLADGLRKKAEGLNREKYIQDALESPLLAKGENEEAAKTLIEDSVEKAYYRAKIRQSLDAFKEDRWGK